MKLKVAKEPTIDPKDIYDRSITAVIKKGLILSDIHNYIPPYQQFRGTLNKIKEKERPALPKSLKDIDFKLPLFKQWTETIEGTPFLRYDNLNNARRIIIFMSEYGIEWLRDATRIHSDGTFEICPELFFQFYVLFGTHGKGENSRILPCGYFLLPGKNEEVYSELFTALKEIIKPSLAPPETPALEPSVALTEFEPAVQNALIDAFPGIDIKGCFFHFKHAIHDWIAQHGYKIDYNSNSSFRVWVDMLGGLGQGVDVISKVADDFIFDLNDSGSREIMNSEIIREDFNFDAANLGGLIGLRHNEDNPVISTNNGYFLPSKFHPNNRLQNSDELEQGDYTIYAMSAVKLWGIKE
jgi:hypothetical protein